MNAKCASSCEKRFVNDYLAVLDSKATVDVEIMWFIGLYVTTTRKPAVANRSRVRWCTRST